MGTLRFQLPKDLAAGAVQELERSCIIGGQDSMPFLTQVVLDPGQLLVSRQEDESGSVAVPWSIENAGTLMTSTATLIERRQPYPLVIELARGKINQLRNQAADWTFGGLNSPPELAESITRAARSFVRAVAYAPAPESAVHAQAALKLASVAGRELVDAYINQVFQVRHQRQPTLDTALGVRLGTLQPSEATSKTLAAAVNTVSLPVAWPSAEPNEGEYSWAANDQLLDWAITAGFHVVGGPLIDFSAAGLPAWLWMWEKDLSSIASFMCDYVRAAVQRYKGRIRTWQLTAAANASHLLGLGEEEQLWLTVRLAEAARQVDPGVELLVGLAEPWGDYMAGSLRSHSPFVFADTLIRSGLNPAALDLEIVMGVQPRGSYCRDLLDASRLIDLYGLLGVPLQITLGLPSSAEADPTASAELSVGAGQWRDGFRPDVQAEWATAFCRLALCKPNVRSVIWAQLSDAEPHLFPWCGLFDAQDKPKPALARLGQLRAEHLG
jgi:hypothetical protein